jgi:hypothetical protein
MTSARTDRWQRYLADLETLASNPAPLESQGKLVRVAGLVLEATGIKVPLGSVCRIQMPSSGNSPRRGTAPVNAEVVGFSGDRAYLMPTDEVQGLSSGARDAAARTAGCTCRWAMACWAASSTRTATHWTAAASWPTSITNPWCGAPSTPWTATRCARRWTPACAPSTPC